MAKGRCLCGALNYELDVPFSAMTHCHCSMCRKHHGTGFGTYVVGPVAGFRCIPARTGASTISRRRTGLQLL